MYFKAHHWNNSRHQMESHGPSPVHPWVRFPESWRSHVHLFKQLHTGRNSMGAHSLMLLMKKSFCVPEMNQLWSEKKPGRDDHYRNVLSPKKTDYSLNLQMRTEIFITGDVPALWWTSQNRQHYKKRRLYGYIVATPQDICQKVKASVWMEHEWTVISKIPPN